EKQAARLELVQQHGRALPEVEDARRAEDDPRAEEGEAHVAAECAVGDHAAEGENPQEQEWSLAPLRRRAPRVRREQHAGAEAEVRRIEEMTAADPQHELARDGQERGERRDPDDVRPEQQRQAEGRDDGREQARVGKIEQAYESDLRSKRGRENERRMPDGKIARRETDAQKRGEEADLQPAWIARQPQVSEAHAEVER